MHTSEFKEKPSSPGLLSRKPAEISEEEKKKLAAGGSVHRSPLDPVMHRGGGRLAAMAFRCSQASNPSGTAALLLSMQRTYGNRQVQRFIQAQLEVSHPGDPAEREADQVAERMMGTPAAAAQPLSEGRLTQPPAAVEKADRESELGQAPTGADLDAQNGVLPHAQEAVSAASNSAGQPLPSALQGRFEQTLGVDLSTVRVHTGSPSVEANKSISARAYTVGNDIHFDQGQYDPESSAGQRLLAHEVVHTVQQGSHRAVQAKLIQADGVNQKTQPASAGTTSGAPTTAGTTPGAPATAGAAVASPGTASTTPAPGTSTPAAPPVNEPLGVKLVAVARVYTADKTTWAITSGTPLVSQQFKPTPLPLPGDVPGAGGETFTPPVHLNIHSGDSVILEIWVSSGTDSQSFFWRCDGVSRLDPMGPQPGGTMPVSPNVPGRTTSVLGPLSGTVAPFAGTTASIQATGQITATSTSGQLQLGANVNSPNPISQVISAVVPQVAVQRNAPAPTYSLAFNADISLQGGPSTPTISDLRYLVGFANDSSTLTSDETTKLLSWVHGNDVGGQAHLREAIRSGQVPVVITGKASTRGNAAHNFALSQRRVEAVRLALQGAASAAGGGRTQGGALGSEDVKIQTEADGDFHDPKPADTDQDRVVEIFISGASATAAVQKAQ